MAKKILLADDSVTIQKVISITLANEDYELTVVGDGDSAVARIKELKPDLVMADVAMPGKTGYEVCDIIKKNPSLCDIPVLLLAGTFEPLNREEAEKVKADESITKPFESQELLDKIKYLLSKSEWLETGGKPLEKEEFAPASALYEEAKPRVEISEDIWEAGGFLGFSEEPEKARESKAEPAPDLSFLEEEIFEHQHDLSGGKFADFGLSEEDTGLRQTPAVPSQSPHAEAFGSEEAGKEPSGTIGTPFDLETFMAEPPKEKAPAPGPAKVDLQPVEELEDVSLSEEPFTLSDEAFKAETFEALNAVAPRQEPAKMEGFDFGAFEPEGSKPEAAQAPPPGEAAEDFFDLGKEPFEVSLAREEPSKPAEPLSFEPEKARIEAPAAQEGTLEADILKASQAAMPEEPLKMEFLEDHLPAVEPLKEAFYEPDIHVERVVAEVSEKAEERLKEEISGMAEGRMEVPREEVRGIVAKMAREIIQEVAWEVVPDLAEEIIRAEIDRIKQALLK
ncbi:MAG: response regulator, partial [Deltaproteobacteria bacterium]